MSARLDHVTVTASDFAPSVAFYDAALGEFDLVRLVEFGDEEEDDAIVEAAAWGPTDGAPVLWLVAGPIATRGLHLEFDADHRAQVSRFHDAALAAGGTSRAAPRRWAIYRRGRYSAIVADPEGNLVEVTAAE